MRRLSIFLFCQLSVFLLRNFAFGQDNYFIQHYTNENGLPANGIKGIELDKKTGFLWIGTQAGLVRFDGKRFASFGLAKDPVAASRIYFIAKNREGTIYCEDDNFSVYRVMQNKPEFVTIDSVLVDPVQLRGGSSQITARRVAQRLKEHPRSSFLPEWMLFEDERGDSSSFSFLYFRQPCRYDASRDTLVCFTGQPFVQMLKLEGRIYFVAENLDLWTYNDSLMKLQPVPLTGMPDWNKRGNERPRFIWKPGMKDPLLIYKKDIWKLQQSADSIYLQPLCRQCCPDDAFIYNAQVWEEQRMIFLGSEKNGLYVVRDPFLLTIRTDTLIEAGRAEYSQAEITPGMITTGYGLSFLPQSKLNYRKGGIQFHPWVIYRDRIGDHWFHSEDTLFHLHHKDGHYIKNKIGSGINKMVFAETKDRIFVITDKVIADITNDQFQPLYQLPDFTNAQKHSLNPDYAIEWKPGILAVAAENLIFFDIEKRTVPDTIPIPGLTAKVRTLLKYDDYLLIGTYGQGFYMYKDGKVKKMPLDKNGYLSYAHCFMADDNGYCWISTNHGLFKASLSALVKAYENNLNEIYYQYFGKDNGIFNTEFNGGCQPCALKLSTGQFSFPSMNGVVIFDPRQQHIPPPAGQLFIDEVWCDSSLHQIRNSSLQTLPYGLKNLRFKLALPQFANSENIYFSYKLEPYNDEWETQDITQNSTLLFGGLKPGNYTLYLRVRNGFEPDQFGTAAITFSISKPWYQTWWFYLLCSIGFILMTWGLVKWRTAWVTKRKEELQQQVAVQTKQLESQLGQLQTQQVRLEEDNQIKSRLIGIISHDMISPLKFVSHVSKKMKKAFPETDNHHHSADFIATVAQELESLSVNILNWIKFHHGSVKMKPERFNLHELIAESTEIASTLAKEKGITVYNDTPEDMEIYQYRQAIGVIIYNLAMNAAKYTIAGEVRITCQSTDHQLLLTVMDTGIGMPPELVDKLNLSEPFVAGYSVSQTSRYQFGYVIIKDLLRLVNGSMKAESVLNKGTRITIRLGIPET